MKNSRNKLVAFGILLGILTAGCNFYTAIRYINKKQIEPLHYTFGEKSLIFVPMVHVGEERFYNSLRDSVKSWKSDNYTVYYEQIIRDKDKMGLDSLSYVQVKRKARKFLELSKYTRENYIKEVSKTFKGKTMQPDHHDIGIDESDLNADVDLQEMVLEYERLYGEISLDSCDYVIPIESSATCRRLRNNIMPVILNFRNRELAKKIAGSEPDKIVVIYGAKHIKPVIKILENSYQ